MVSDSGSHEIVDLSEDSVVIKSALNDCIVADISDELAVSIAEPSHKSSHVSSQGSVGLFESKVNTSQSSSNRLMSNDEAAELLYLRNTVRRLDTSWPGMVRLLASRKSKLEV